MTNFTPFDIVCVVLILIFIVRCAIHGFISELMSMASIVLGLLASLFFFRKGGDFIRERFMPESQVIPNVVAFILLFLIVFLIIKLLEHLLKGIVEGIKLGKADRFIGIIFGALEGLIVVSLVVFIISIQPLFDPQKVLNNSFFAEIILPLISGVRPAAIDTVLLNIFRLSGAAVNV